MGILSWKAAMESGLLPFWYHLLWTWQALALLGTGTSDRAQYPRLGLKIQWLGEMSRPQLLDQTKSYYITCLVSKLQLWYLKPLCVVSGYLDEVPSSRRGQNHGQSVVARPFLMRAWLSLGVSIDLLWWRMACFKACWATWWEPVSKG